MKEYIVRYENNKFTIEGEVVHCKECRNRHRQKRCAGRHADWFCADGLKQVTGKLNDVENSTVTEDSEDCKEQKSKLESDLISRQAAIEALQDDWIPVSDDTLPDTDIDVNVTLKDFAETRTGFFADEGWWLITKEGTLENYPLGYVIAWKPLPKPYKESEE